jgi:hypothetical protein
MGEIILFEDHDGKAGIEVLLDDDTVWLTVNQMAELFESSRRNIGEHLQHIYTDGELSEEATRRNFRQVRRPLGGDAFERHLGASAPGEAGDRLLQGGLAPAP